MVRCRSWERGISFTNRSFKEGQFLIDDVTVEDVDGTTTTMIMITATRNIMVTVMMITMTAAMTVMIMTIAMTTTLTATQPFTPSPPFLRYCMRKRVWEAVDSAISGEAKYLVHHLLALNPEERISVSAR